MFEPPVYTPRPTLSRPITCPRCSSPVALERSTLYVTEFQCGTQATAVPAGWLHQPSGSEGVTCEYIHSLQGRLRSQQSVIDGFREKERMLRSALHKHEVVNRDRA